MVFQPPSWVPDITTQVHPNANVAEWALESRRASGSVRAPFICALTGKKYTLKEVREKVNALAKALCSELGWSPNQGIAEEKVIGVLAVNSLDFLVVCWAIHRIGGICLLLQPTTSPVEISSHMSKAKCDILITCEELLPSCKEILNRLPKAPRRMFSINTSNTQLPNFEGEIKCLPQLYQEGSILPDLEQLQPKDAHTTVAFYLTTSGTSGPQKLAIITHANLIANVTQAAVFESSAGYKHPDIGLAVLPLNHGYGLVTTHAMFVRGDSAVLHPNFNMQLVLKSIQEHSISRLYLVPPVIAALAANPVLFEIFDLSSVQDVVLGAAACSDSVTKKMKALMPSWSLLVGYELPTLADTPRTGLTECVSIVTFSRAADIMPGSSGCLFPSNQGRLIDQDGKEITSYNTAGELYLKSAAMIPGYLGEDDAMRAKFTVDGWLPTGDIGFFRRSPHGDDHLYLVDRLKDMIKVKGLQVNPAEIEELLRVQPGVLDAAVIGIVDDEAGERPLAFVVPAKQDMTAQEKKELILHLDEAIKAQLDETHWLRKQIRFIEELPRGQSGKVLKKILREKAKQKESAPMNGANGTNGSLPEKSIEGANGIHAQNGTSEAARV
ncbi:putative NRPS-like protein biosynthetic cluster [Fusarium musae]|uniref:NRPS-like protein biosynthetic cluster n=1 Tax=Fusarium musae TaxID=1042133 RepID=A0A9P8D3V9_9HYPO|nr:putative NRPS-like protein biosynthetic cluster [Fusarium musae]KAG9494875.1 putative NRPS-like protein biosynthetic cluster [Fusarium musae]